MQPLSCRTLSKISLMTPCSYLPVLCSKYIGSMYCVVSQVFSTDEHVSRFFVVLAVLNCIVECICASDEVYVCMYV